MLQFLLFILIVLAAQLSGEENSTKENAWPTPDEWQSLKESVKGKLIQEVSPFNQPNVDPAIINRWIERLQNPFVIEEYPWGTQSTGWLNAWSAESSPYVVVANSAADIVAAVKFAKKHHLKLVVKGTGHDYLGRSCAPHSLLIWTHLMRNINLHEAFIPSGAPEQKKGVPAVTIEAGARWGEVYQEVTTKHNRYVQGGGCASVGAVGGFLQGGGFGSCSKKYGIAAGSLLQAEVVTANGDILIANPYQNADLFWALKGGGGCTFGVVTKATLQTYEPPNYVGLVNGNITARTDEAFQALLEYFIHFYRETLNNEHWGEQVVIKPTNTLGLWFVSQGLTQKEMEERWNSLQRWIAERSTLYTIDIHFTVLPGNKMWDKTYLAIHFPTVIKPDTFQNGDLFYWASNQHEVLAYWYTYQSRWLPFALFQKNMAKKLAQALFDASRHWELSLHFNKGLAGGSSEAIRRSRETSINPAVLDAAALVIFGAQSRNVFPNLKDHEPSIQEGLKALQKVNAAAKVIADIAPNSGAYSNEADYFQPNWQQAFWGEHYPKLLEIKRKYDPDGLFKCHHCVGSMD